MTQSTDCDTTLESKKFDNNKFYCIPIDGYPYELPEEFVKTNKFRIGDVTQTDGMVVNGECLNNALDETKKSLELGEGWCRKCDQVGVMLVLFITKDDKGKFKGIRCCSECADGEVQKAAAII